MREGRIARGWRLTMAAWTVMRQDRTMPLLALIGTVCGLAGAALMLYAGGLFSPGGASGGRFGLVALLFVYPLTFVSVFFNVALTAAASAMLESNRLGVGGALREASRRVGRIAAWALLVSVVGVLIDRIVARIPGAGRLVSWLLETAWALATIFAIPLLVVEEAGPIATARGSAALARSKWGEGLTGIVSIGAWTSIAMFAVVFFVIAGLSVLVATTAGGIVLIGIGVVVFFAISAFANATRQVFNLALFRYATGLDTPGFEGDALADPFKRRRG